MSTIFYTQKLFSAESAFSVLWFLLHFLLLKFLLQCRLLRKDGVDLIIKILDHDLGFQIHLVIISARRRSFSS